MEYWSCSASCWVWWKGRARKYLAWMGVVMILTVRTSAFDDVMPIRFSKKVSGLSCGISNSSFTTDICDTRSRA